MGSGRMPREQAEPGSADRAVLALVTSAPGGTCPPQVSCPDTAAWALPKYSPVYSQHRGGWPRHGTGTALGMLMGGSVGPAGGSQPSISPWAPQE